MTEFASRRTLVVRRFLRNRAAVASLAALLLLFVSAYALPTPTIALLLRRP